MAYSYPKVWIGLDTYPEECVEIPEDQTVVDTGFSNTGKPTCIINYIESKEDL